MAEINRAMKIGILGPGAIGGLVGSLLFKTGNEVCFIGKEQTVNSINRDGITFKSSFYGDFTIYPKACTSAEEILDVIFIAVKGYELQNALKLISGHLGEQTILVSLLNGLGHREVIRALPAKNVIVGTIGAVEVALGENRHVIHRSTGKTHIEMASDSDAPAARISMLAEVLHEAGLSVSVLKTENEVIWRKLARLAAISTMTSIARASLGTVRKDPELNWQMAGVVSELCRIAETQNFIIQADEVMSQIEALPERLTTSMQRDIQAGKPSEIEAILGGPLRLGKAAGLNLPFLEKSYEQLIESIRTSG